MSSHRRLTLLIGLVLMFSASASISYAQQVFGSIFGTVTDPNGAVVINAKVTITDVNKGTKFEVVTDSVGNYNKGQLVPDAYTVAIEAPGFSRVLSSELEVRVDEAARFDASMKVGEVNTQVEVTATAPLLQTDRADVAQTYTAEEVNRSTACRISGATFNPMSCWSPAPPNWAGSTPPTRIRRGAFRWWSAASSFPRWVTSWTVPPIRIPFWGSSL